MARRKNELNPIEEMVVGVFLIVAAISAAITAGVKSDEAGTIIALIVCVIALTVILKSAVNVKKPKLQKAVPGSASPTLDEAVNGRAFHIQTECRSTRDQAVSFSDSNEPEKTGRDTP